MIRLRKAGSVALAIVAGLFLSSCSAPLASIREEPAQATASAPLPVKTVKPGVPAAGSAVELPAATLFRPAEWEDLPGWSDDDLAEAWPAWRMSCKALVGKPGWEAVCQSSARVDGRDSDAVREFFHGYFRPYEVVNQDETVDGLVTGYYEPIIRGDRVRTDLARFPVYGVPEDLVTVDLASLYPELKHMRLRGRVVGNRLVPYFSRGEIADENSAFSGTPIAWAEDQVELFYLHIQGSGRVELPTGEQIRIGYAEQNGHPFRSVARILIQRGELAAHEASMSGVSRWGRKNPEKLAALLNENPSFIFFRRLPDSPSGPLGALGVPLTERRSIAVDPRFIPLGAPVFLSTACPMSDEPLNRLVMAQDTGGAIRGAVRVDFFWGLGDEAGAFASRTKHPGRKWVLLPAGFKADGPSGRN